jgi:hypothetical protein
MSEDLPFTVPVFSLQLGPAFGSTGKSSSGAAEKSINKIYQIIIEHTLILKVNLNAEMEIQF